MKNMTLKRVKPLWPFSKIGNNFFLTSTASNQCGDCWKLFVHFLCPFFYVRRKRKFSWCKPRLNQPFVPKNSNFPYLALSAVSVIIFHFLQTDLFPGTLLCSPALSMSVNWLSKVCLKNAKSFKSISHVHFFWPWFWLCRHLPVKFEVQAPIDYILLIWRSKSFVRRNSHISLHSKTLQLIPGYSRIFTVHKANVVPPICIESFLGVLFEQWCLSSVLKDQYPACYKCCPGSTELNLGSA